MATNDENKQGVFEQLADGLQRQIDSLSEVVTTIDHKVRGNGQPGMASDLATVKSTLQHIEEDLKDFEARIGQTVVQSITYERERVQSSLKDTGKLKEIAKQVAQEVMREELGKRADEFTRKLDEFKLLADKKETAPGSWRYFVEKLGLPVVMMIVGWLIAHLPELLAWLIKKP